MSWELQLIFNHLDLFRNFIQQRSNSFRKKQDQIKKGCCKIRNGTEELICPLSADLQLAYHNY